MVQGGWMILNVSLIEWDKNNQVKSKQPYIKWFIIYIILYNWNLNYRTYL